MDNWIKTKNNKRVNIDYIPTVSIEQIRSDFKKSEKRVIGFFGKNEELEKVRLYIILADDKNGDLYITSVLFNAEDKEYNSLSSDFPQFNIFEREFYEEFKIRPLNHPWLKPLRKNQSEYPFFMMQGEDIHEVAVGPIHAGVIEPGHFRFMCQGEKIYNLEIMLGYQNKNVEQLMLKPNNQLAESISGDSVIAHNMAYSQLYEALSENKIPKRAKIIRRIALELERIAIHLGDMGAISGDIAYLPGASVFGVTRTLVINTMLEISGSRFGRGLIDVGGVNFDITTDLSKKIKSMLAEVMETTKRTSEIIMKKPSCISRMEQTGTVSKETAIILGAVGMAARASGVDIDSRFDFEDEFYDKSLRNKDVKYTGDVFSRFNLRYKEIRESVKIINDLSERLKETDNILKSEVTPLIKNSLSISIVEGWRGEIVHTAITDENGEISRYKIKDPSFNNWYMLSIAVRNNGISDFPVCNKSFNLSYCGNDL